jgi:hypothetical protein
MWGPQHLTALWATTACYSDRFILVSRLDNAYIQEVPSSDLAQDTGYPQPLKQVLKA